MQHSNQAPCIPQARRENSLNQTEKDDLEAVLLQIAEDEERFGEIFFEEFFRQRPDTRELFGAYSISEQEEMIRETLRSLVGWLEDAPWLAENLHALGDSHLEYGVTTDMYESYVDVMLSTSHKLLGDAFDRKSEAALKSAIMGVCNLMDPVSE